MNVRWLLHGLGRQVKLFVAGALCMLLVLTIGTAAAFLISIEGSELGYF